MTRGGNEQVGDAVAAHSGVDGRRAAVVRHLHDGESDTGATGAGGVRAVAAVPADVNENVIQGVPPASVQVWWARGGGTAGSANRVAEMEAATRKLAQAILDDSDSDSDADTEEKLMLKQIAGKAEEHDQASGRRSLFAPFLRTLRGAATY